MLSANQGSGKSEGKIDTIFCIMLRVGPIYHKQMASIAWLWALVSYGLSILFCFLLNEVDQANYDGWKCNTKVKKHERLLHIPAL
jgi:hypothetical protein